MIEVGRGGGVAVAGQILDPILDEAIESGAVLDGTTTPGASPPPAGVSR